MTIIKQESSSTQAPRNDVSLLKEAVKNDITYLSNLKQSASLPYLKHIQLQTETTPLQSYLEQRLKQLESDKPQGKSQRLLKLGERKFSKLNQKASIKRLLAEDPKGVLSARAAEHKINRSLSGDNHTS